MDTNPKSFVSIGVHSWLDKPVIVRLRSGALFHRVVHLPLEARVAVDVNLLVLG